MRFKSRSRALVGAATAGLLGLAGLAFTATPAQATEETDVVRVAGTTRYGTAAEAATQAYPDGSANVVLASGEMFPDALSAAGVAGSLEAPILLTQQDTVPQDTLDALDDLGATSVTIMGGTAAVSQGVEDALAADGLTVDRIAGANRFATAAEAASEIGGTTAVLADGFEFADALAMSPGAHALELPILLTPTAMLSAEAQAYIDSAGVTDVIIAGGTAAVSQDIQDALEADGIDVTRLAGATRYETAIEVANFHFDQGFDNDALTMATGENFADALAGGPFASQMNTPLVLTQSNVLTPSTEAFLESIAPTLDTLYILGGTAAISNTVANAAAEAAQSDQPATATIRPELVSAEIVQTVTPGNATPSQPAGTYVRYTFDEAIALGATAGSFRVYYSNSTLAEVGDNASIQPGGLSVIVRFGDQDTAAEAGALSVATVVQGAVLDAAGNSNPEGDAAIGDGSQSGVTAGVTAAPDVTGVSGYRQGAGVGTTAVDFMFDEGATVLNTTGFSLVLQDNTVQSCTSSTTPAAGAPSGGTVPGGSGTTTITVVCGNPDITGPNPGGTPLSTANVARGAVAANTVADASAVPVANPLQIADSGNSGNTSGPDLVSASFVQGTNDAVLYVFDANVTGNGAATLFNAYLSNGSQIQGGTVSVSATDPRQVLVTFGSSTALDTAVGASVDAGAVTAGTLGTNQDDEVAVTNTTATTIVPGRTAAPDLTAVSVAAATGFSPATATFTFDQNVEPGANIVDLLFHLYTANGVRLTAAACNRGTTLSAIDADSDAPSASVTCRFGVTADATTNNNVINAVLGTVEAGAVDDDTNTALTNPEGAETTTGGTGTPAV